jgi:type IV pilus assembly protein PilW
MSDERGMTLIELLVAMTVGIIVLLGAFMFLDRAFQINRETADRADSAQKGRLALEQMTRALRSQVCMGTPRAAIKSADGNSVSFTTDLSGGTTLPEKRTITYDPVAKTLTDYTYPASGTYPNLTFPASPTRTRVLATNVVPDGAKPIFSYYALGAAGTGADTQLSVPLSATDMGRASRIAIAFTTRPTGAASNDRRATTLNDDVYARSADPLNPDGGMTCL